jgi:predicted DNA-binding transcriptional regulator AlpA
MPEEPFFLRLPQVLEKIPISKSSWWSGIRSGRFPKPIKLTERTSAWRRADIEQLCERLSGKSMKQTAGSTDHGHVESL